jgi:hypothetical protein
MQTLPSVSLYIRIAELSSFRPSMPDPGISRSVGEWVPNDTPRSSRYSWPGYAVTP